ncbi:hypothetical protein K461DRAFT_110166 [Myriangium duriaei CBS 260.36]|uniref:F-box domain-containing protein n=1 Tax=Myriangium duriaei CBS 260.36 TaxID=1168546 RepID=A0A9P4JAD7_9PEZI|nr:hypothetical protein K461DRAFT_110166 [Myriangium duriaei CBS 260.36]
MATTMPSEFRSAVEFAFDENQADAIVRTTSYHRKDFPLAIIWFPPRTQVNIQPTIATSFARTSSSGISHLYRLPLELVQDVLLRVDMQSLLNFRQTNLKSRQMVDSLHQYQLVVSHGLNLLCALLRSFDRASIVEGERFQLDANSKDLLLSRS